MNRSIFLLCAFVSCMTSACASMGWSVADYDEVFNGLEHLSECTSSDCYTQTLSQDFDRKYIASADAELLIYNVPQDQQVNVAQFVAPLIIDPHNVINVNTGNPYADDILKDPATRYRQPRLDAYLTLKMKRLGSIDEQREKLWHALDKRNALDSSEYDNSEYSDNAEVAEAEQNEQPATEEEIRTNEILSHLQNGENITSADAAFVMRTFKDHPEQTNMAGLLASRLSDPQNVQMLLDVCTTDEAKAAVNDVIKPKGKNASAQTDQRAQDAAKLADILGKLQANESITAQEAAFVASFYDGDSQKKIAVKLVKQLNDPENIDVLVAACSSDDAKTAVINAHKALTQPAAPTPDKRPVTPGIKKPKPSLGAATTPARNTGDFVDQMDLSNCYGAIDVVTQNISGNTRISADDAARIVSKINCSSNQEEVAIYLVNYLSDPQNVNKLAAACYSADAQKAVLDAAQDAGIQFSPAAQNANDNAAQNAPAQNVVSGDIVNKINYKKNNIYSQVEKLVGNSLIKSTDAVLIISEIFDASEREKVAVYLAKRLTDPQNLDALAAACDFYYSCKQAVLNVK